MAKQTVVVLTDDLTSEPLPEGGGETVVFSLDGWSYEIDLSHENSRVLREVLRTYTEHGRRVGLGHPHTRRRATGAGKNREAAVIREWAVEKGLLTPGSRGRIPAPVREAYLNRTAMEKIVDDAERANVHPLPEAPQFAEPAPAGRRQRRA